jgi:hypothetical protein
MTSSKFKNKSVMSEVKAERAGDGKWYVSGTVLKKGTVTIPVEANGKTSNIKIKVKM